MANGTRDELADFFAQPEQLRLHYLETALLFTDQIPVWSKVEAGCVLVSDKKLSALRSGQRQRQARRKAAAKRLRARTAGLELPDEEPLVPEQSGDEGGSYLAKGPGSTNDDRWRVTLMARQAVEHFWNPGRSLLALRESYINNYMP